MGHLVRLVVVQQARRDHRGHRVLADPVVHQGLRESMLLDLLGLVVQADLAALQGRRVLMLRAHLAPVAPQGHLDLVDLQE